MHACIVVAPDPTSSDVVDSIAAPLGHRSTDAFLAGTVLHEHRHHTTGGVLAKGAGHHGAHVALVEEYFVAMV